MSPSTSLARYSGHGAFAGVLLALAAVLTALGGSGWWAYGEFARQAATFRTYKMLQEGAGRADSLSNAYGRLLKEMRNFRQALPAENQGSYVLNLLVAGAKSQDLGLAGVTALDEIPFPGYGELPVEVSVTGEFPKLVRYLHALETQGLALQVRRLSVHGESMNHSRISAKLEISVFAPNHGSAASPPGPETALPAERANAKTDSAKPVDRSISPGEPVRVPESISPSTPPSGSPSPSSRPEGAAP